MSNQAHPYNPYIEYTKHHETHPELDHHFDHRHDIYPHEYHERNPDSWKNSFDDFERAAEKHREALIVTHGPPHHHEHHWGHREYHPELRHEFDHYHDTHPYEYHDHSIHKAFDYGTQKNDYGFARAAEKRELPFMEYVPPHHEHDYVPHRHDHPELHHEYDHFHDRHP